MEGFETSVSVPTRGMHHERGLMVRSDALIRCEPWRAKRRRVVPSSPSAECVPVERCGSSGRREHTKASRQGVKSLWNDVPTPCGVGTGDAGRLGPPEAMIAA